MKSHIIAALALFALPACVSAGDNFSPRRATYAMNAEEIAIRAIISTQAAAWNRGDIDGFMQGYWNSPELRFASGGTVTRGWQTTRDRYRANYGTDIKSMGRLTFSGIEVVQLAPDAAIVHGRWQLAYPGRAPNGLFTLVFRRIGGKWVIVSDTTTAAPDTPPAPAAR